MHKNNLTFLNNFLRVFQNYSLIVDITPSMSAAIWYDIKSHMFFIRQECLLYNGYIIRYDFNLKKLLKNVNIKNCILINSNCRCENLFLGNLQKN